MKAKTKKLTKNEWMLQILKENKPVFNTRIFKEKVWYCNDHNMREFKTLTETKEYFIKNLNDFR